MNSKRTHWRIRERVRLEVRAHLLSCRWCDACAALLIALRDGAGLCVVTDALALLERE